MTASRHLVESKIFPGLSIIHANHMEDLREVAVKWIKSHPLSPLENETLIVQSNGMAQWLKLSMASNEGLGISAAVTMELPARFIWNAYRAVLKNDQIPEQSPYDRECLKWRILRLLPTLAAEVWFSPLVRYLSDDADLRKRYQLAGHLAGLYDQYQVYRADWLEDWIEGKDRLRNARGTFSDIPCEHRWQVELWRMIYQDIPEPMRNAGRFRLHHRFLRTARDQAVHPVELPRRVIVFGISSLPQQTLEVIHAVSRHSQVLVFAHNPCRHYWADIMEDRSLLRNPSLRHPRKQSLPEGLPPEQLYQQVNPLLAAWGKQGREYIGLLYGVDRPETYRKHFGEIDLFRNFAVSDPSAPLLSQVQQAILDLIPLPAAGQAKPSVSPDDNSIAFVQAHSRQREIEILQDHLLSLFEQDPGLVPQDVLVMTPDIDNYSPHIEAVFGSLSPQDRRYIPYAVADRPEHASLSVLQALEKLLHLPSLRVTAGDLLDFLAVSSLRERFGIKASDLPRLEQWINGSGIRWGLNEDHRKGFGLPGGLEQNTCRFGLQRMLLGYAVGDGDSWQGIEPYGEIGGLEASLAGSFFAFVEALDLYRRRFNQPLTAEQWTHAIVNLTHTFFLPEESSDQLLLGRVAEIVEEWRNACDDAGLKERLPLPVVREALLETMTKSAISQRFLIGRINFCVMMPMRAIPFQVVCLLGMNDGEYPRTVQPLAFDLISIPGHYRPGDRSHREDDRYLFLEALLSARKQLYISHIGRSVQDNSKRMPSVLVNQLRDYLAAGWQSSRLDQKGEGVKHRLLDQLTFHHPLQPFSPTYFQPKKWPERFTYASEWENVLFSTQPNNENWHLPPVKRKQRVQVAPLVQFFKNPIKAFYNQRLNIYLEDVGAVNENEEPFAVDNLDVFQLGMPLLEAGLAASPSRRDIAVTQAAKRLLATGDLPLFGFGQRAVDQLIEPIRNLLEKQERLLIDWDAETDVAEIQVRFTDPPSACDKMEDWLDGIRKRKKAAQGRSVSPAHARWEFYPLCLLDKKGKLLRTYPLTGVWIRHLVGCAQGLDLTSYLVAPDGIITLDPTEKQRANRCLGKIVSHWTLGLERPLPVTARTALAFLSAGNPNNLEEPSLNQRVAARKAYEGDGYNTHGELGYGDGAYLRRTYPDFGTLWCAHDNEFQTLAETLYAPLMAAAIP